VWSGVLEKLDGSVMLEMENFPGGSTDVVVKIDVKEIF
jgi:hypothetical protein